MNNIPNPDSWMDVFVILACTAMVAVPSWFAQRAHKSAEVIRNQVVNGHTEPMRADLDRAIEAINNLAHDVRGLRKDVYAEEERRHQSVKEIRDEVDWKFNELNRRLGA